MNLKSLIPGYNFTQFIKNPSGQNLGAWAFPWVMDPEKQEASDPYAAQREAQAIAQRQLEERKKQQQTSNSAIERLFREKNPIPPLNEKSDPNQDSYVPAGYNEEAQALDLRYHPNESERKKRGLRGLTGVGGN